MPSGQEMDCIGPGTQTGLAKGTREFEIRADDDKSINLQQSANNKNTVHCVSKITGLYTPCMADAKFCYFFSYAENTVPSVTVH